MEPRGWVAARDLREGDRAWTADRRSLVFASARPEQGKTRVYNLEVEQNHTYFVGRALILAHNNCISLPAWRKVTLDIAHIAERLIAGGPLTEGRTVFPSTMNARSVARTIREAYEAGAKVRVQGDRVVLHGDAAGLTIEMWFNRLTNTIETAYPITQ